MGDNRTKEQRSYCMKQIRSKDTTPEMKVRRYLHANGFRYSLHSKKLPGKPDLTLTKHSAVVFVNGCFWHGHRNCKGAKTPATNKKFWIDKIEKTRARDTRCRKELKDKNWKVLTVWECQLKKDKVEQILSSLANKIES
jgi:DNA mismatch endonuclease (patch repair protein)